MCTVTYIPKDSRGFILTSNRDEQASRSAKKLIRRKELHQEIIFPQDAKAGGTWIAISSNDKMVCLLNGAFVKHKHQPPYRRSRGLMVLDFFTYLDANTFFAKYEFQGMEPFTMIIYDQGKLIEARWNEEKLHFSTLDIHKSYIWSSATLYSEEVKSKREQWFEHWKNTTPIIDKENILDFHYHAGDGNPYNDVIMNRNGIVQTVSITSIEKGEQFLKMDYQDLLDGNKLQDEIKLKHSPNY